MDTLLTLVTGFGYFITLMMIGIVVWPLIAMRYGVAIDRFLDSTVPWPEDDPQDLMDLRDEVMVARSETDSAAAAALEALASLPQHKPVWQTSDPVEYPDGISLAIIRSHPGGHVPGLQVAYRRWRAILAR